MAHSGQTCRAPWPEEFCQQHVAMIARGIGGTMTWGFDHVASLCPSGKDTGLLPQHMVDEIVKRQHAVAARIEEASRGTTPYRKGVLLRYHPETVCNPRGAAAVYERYAFWKDQGKPVSLIWDERQADETVPEDFEFLLEGGAPQTDMAIRSGEGTYVVTLINLRNRSRQLRLRIRLQERDMTQYRVRRVDEGTPVATRSADGNLYCSTELPSLGFVVIRLDTIRTDG